MKGVLHEGCQLLLLELTFLHLDRIELRSGQGARTKFEIYDRVS